jgi:hypothetical protein
MRSFGIAAGRHVVSPAAAHDFATSSAPAPVSAARRMHEPSIARIGPCTLKGAIVHCPGSTDSTPGRHVVDSRDFRQQGSIRMQQFGIAVSASDGPLLHFSTSLLEQVRGRLRERLVAWQERT